MNELFINYEHKEVMRFTLPIGIPLDNGKLIKDYHDSIYLVADGDKFYIRNPT